MPTEPVHRPFARRLLRAVLGPGEAGDPELLARFVRTRDEESFAELVRRHGRMVLAVGRRVTGHPQDAEDAFQAAFMVLARRASHVNRPEQLANWLYGVAYRTALEARAARRRVLEHPVSAVPEPAAPMPPEDNRELRRVIDEELAKLPDKYRAAVVLCDLEGLPRVEAAKRLQIPEGTLSSRLAYARKVLATRLARRGITSTAGAIGVALSREAIGGTLPRTLILLTARAARASAHGAIPTDLVSASVSSITEGVLKTMFIHRLRMMLGLLVVSGLIGVGAVGFAQYPGQTSVQPDVIRNNAGQPDNDPFGDPIALQRPKPEKVEAKGIEDEDVPLPATPTQAVVRVEEGKLIVRTRVSRVVAVAPQNIPGQAVVAWRQKSGVNAATYDLADIAVFDMKGNRLLPKAWKEKLKNDVHALIGFDGRLPNPREMTLFKDDTLMVILPAPMTGGYGATATAPAAVPSSSVPFPSPAVLPPQPRYTGSPSAYPSRAPSPGTTQPPRPARVPQPGTAPPPPDVGPGEQLPPSGALPPRVEVPPTPDPVGPGRTP